MFHENRLIGYNSNPSSGVGSSVSSAEIEDGEIVNADINANAAIAATKIADGSVSDAEFQRLDATSSIQTQLDAKAPLASPTFTGTVTLPVGLTGVVRVDSGVVSVDTDVTDVVAAASEEAAGKVELATAAEITTGTDTARVLTPDAYAGSNFGKRVVEVVVFDSATNVATGDGKAYFTIPSTLNGWNLVRAQATVVTAGTTNATTVMVHNLTQTADMLSVAISIASGGVAGTVGTIDTGNDDVATDDRIRIDVDSVSTTPPQGLTVILEFQLP